MKLLILIPYILSTLFSGCTAFIPDFIIEQEKSSHRNHHKYDYSDNKLHNNNKSNHNHHKHSQTTEVIDSEKGEK